MSSAFHEAHRNRPSGSAAGKKPRRRLLLIGGGVTTLLVVIAAATAWLGIKGSMISTELGAAADLAAQLKDDVRKEDMTAAGQTVSELKVRAGRARAAATDPIWILASALPVIGKNFSAASEVATSADDLAHLAAGPLVSVYQSMDWTMLAPNENGIDLASFTAAEPTISSAAHAVRESSDRLSKIDSNELLPQVAGPLINARDDVESLRGALDTASDVVRIAPAMMGEQTPQKYLLLIQNNAEIRATGGIPGAVAVLRVDKGKLTLEAQTSAGALGSFIPPVSVETEQEAIYSARLGKYLQDVNLTPDFPTSAASAHAMWERKHGERLDGVISVDAGALGYILAATGPVVITDPHMKAISNGLPAKLTSKNVLPTLLSDVYAKIAEPTFQDAYFAGVAKEVFAALSTGDRDPTRLFDGVGRGVGEGRILIWSYKQDEQSVIARYPISGSISGASISPAQFGVYFNDGTGAKMDFYVKRSVQLIQECTRDEYSEVTVRITSTNTAPPGAGESLPPYVTGNGVFGIPPGTVQTNVTAYGPVQANIAAATEDGVKTSVSSHRHDGRPVGTTTVTLAPGESTTVEMRFSKIVQHSTPFLRVTPTVQDVRDVILETRSEKCAPAA